MRPRSEQFEHLGSCPQPANLRSKLPGSAHLSSVTRKPDLAYEKCPADQIHTQTKPAALTIRATGGILVVAPDEMLRVRRRRHKRGLYPIVLNDATWMPAVDLREGDYLCM